MPLESVAACLHRLRDVAGWIVEQGAVALTASVRHFQFSGWLVQSVVVVDPMANGDFHHLFVLMTIKQIIDNRPVLIVSRHFIVPFWPFYCGAITTSTSVAAN